MRSKKFERPWEPMKINISLLRINSPRQRALDPRKIERIKREFNPLKVKRISVVAIEANGEKILAVADGQHTVTAIQELYGNVEVDCDVTMAIDEEEFVEIVRATNPEVADKPTKNDWFWIDLERKQQYAVDIRKAAQSARYQIVSKLDRKRNAIVRGETVVCVSELLRIYREADLNCVGGYDGLASVFKFAREAFGTEFATDYLLLGIWKFMKCCKDDPAYNLNKIIPILRTEPFESLKVQMEDIADKDKITKATAFAIVMRRTYNTHKPRGSKTINATIG